MIIFTGRHERQRFDAGKGYRVGYIDALASGNLGDRLGAVNGTELDFLVQRNRGVNTGIRG